MSEDEKIGVFAAPEFLDFVEHSTKIIQRALNDNYDYVRDYTIGAETGAYVACYLLFEMCLTRLAAVMIQKVDASSLSALSSMSAMAETGLLLTSIGRRRYFVLYLSGITSLTICTVPRA